MTDENTSHLLEWSDDDQPFSIGFEDSFFSKEDGRAESEHVFINGNRLVERWNAGENLTIGELGFGTGLNFLETWRQWCTKRNPEQVLNFISVEAFPLAEHQIERALSVWPELADFQKELSKNWQICRQQTVAMDAQTTLRVVEAKATDAFESFPDAIDAWYLDGFAPSKNPEMWSTDVVANLSSCTAPGGTFATYTSAGWVRRNLEAAGFAVNRQSGYGRKRHMMFGQKCI